MFSWRWQKATTVGSHNVTITATERIRECLPNPCYGDFSDVNLQNNRFDSDFGLLLNSQLTPSPNPIRIVSGSTGTALITVRALPDFSGTVSISASPPTGWGVTLNTTSVPLNPGQNLNATMTLSIPSSTLGANYTVTVVGTSVIGGQTVTHSINMPVQVSDFTLVASPSSLNTPEGRQVSTTLTLTAVNAPTAPVALSGNIY